MASEERLDDLAHAVDGAHLTLTSSWSLPPTSNERRGPEPTPHGVDEYTASGSIRPVAATWPSARIHTAFTSATTSTRWPRSMPPRYSTVARTGAWTSRCSSSIDQ